jgi:hypothetical protein
MKQDTSDRILTRHPEGKKGVRIDRRKYELVRSAIMRSLKTYQELTHTQLNQAVRHLLPGDFSGSAPWYIEMVKLDLEAGNTIERREQKPQTYRLKEQDGG